MKEQMNQLEGKKVIVLGGSSGIGLATAKAAAACGAQLIIVSGNKDRINNALKELPKGTAGLAVDLTSEEQIKKFFEQTGAFDHLVFTAGENLQLGTIDATNIEDARRYFNVRYWGAVMALKYGAPHISKDGSVVLTSGIVSRRPNKGWSLGASICAAMEGFTRAMAMELTPVRVNCVVPGVVKTNLWNNLSEEDRNNLYEQTRLSLPVKRIGEAEDISQAYLYLLCQPYSTGQTIVVDGGAVLV